MLASRPSQQLLTDSNEDKQCFMQLLDNLRVTNEFNGMSNSTGPNLVGGNGSSHSPSGTHGMQSQNSALGATGSTHQAPVLSFAANHMQSLKSHPKNSPLNAEAFWNYMDTLTRSNASAGKYKNLSAFETPFVSTEFSEFS